MLRGFLLSLGCLIAACGIYASVLLLELYWNLYEWEPKWDGRAAGMIVALAVCVTTMAFLSRATSPRFGKVFGCLLALLLLGLGFYVLAPEPLSKGLFGRSAPSAAWYRFSRLAAMGLPLLFWIRSVNRDRTRFGEIGGEEGAKSVTSDRLRRPDAEAKEPTS